MKDIVLGHFITALRPRGLRIMPVHSIYRCGEHPSKPAAGIAEIVVVEQCCYIYSKRSREI